MKGLLNEKLFVQYLNSLIFILNIATTTGFSEQGVYNNNERVIFIFYIFLGNGLFAIAFGMLASNSETFPESFQDVFYQMKLHFDNIFCFCFFYVKFKNEFYLIYN